MSEDPYAVLGVTRDASAEELRRAHRRLIRLTHPDLGGSAAAFRSIQRAWEEILAEGASASDRASASRRRAEEAAHRRRAERAAEQEARRVAEEWRRRTAAYRQVVNDLPRRYQRWVELGAGIDRARAWRRFDRIALVAELVIVLGWSAAGLASVRFGTSDVGVDLLAVALLFVGPLLAFFALAKLAMTHSRRDEVWRHARPYLGPDEVYAHTDPTER